MTDTFYYTDRNTPLSSAVDAVFYDTVSESLGVRYHSGPTIYAWAASPSEFHDIINSYSVGQAVRNFRSNRAPSLQFDDAGYRTEEPMVTNNYHINLSDTLNSAQDTATQVANAVSRAFGEVNAAEGATDRNSYVVTLDVKGYRIDVEVEADDVTEAADEAIMTLSDGVEVLAVVRD